MMAMETVLTVRTEELDLPGPPTMENLARVGSHRLAASRDHAMMTVTPTNEVDEAGPTLDGSAFTTKKNCQHVTGRPTRIPTAQHHDQDATTT